MIMYQMTTEQSEEYRQGGELAERLTIEVAEDLQDAGEHGDVDVLLDDGSVAFSVWQTV